jgi:hypothetical protein
MTSADTSVAICANKYQQPTLGKITISFQVCFLLPVFLCPRWKQLLYHPFLFLFLMVHSCVTSNRADTLIESFEIVR